MAFKSRPVLTPQREEILRLLARWRILTTDQAAKELNCVDPNGRRRLNRDLEALQELDMIECYSYEPEKGQGSRRAFVLLTAGARAIHFIEYGSHYRRRPTRERLEMWEMERELVREFERLPNWHLTEPTVYNNLKPLPEVTPQGEILIEAYKNAEYDFLSDLEENDPHNPKLNDLWSKHQARFYEVAVHLQANDYVGSYHDPNGKLKAAVFILADPQKGELFWKKRIEQYQNTVKFVPVFGVFKTEVEARTNKPLLSSGGIRLTVLDRLHRLLPKLEEESRPVSRL